MKTELQESMTSAVFVEFRDAQGHTLGQALYTDWRGRPVPAVGDVLTSEVAPQGALAGRRLRGRVVVRQFEVQYDQDGAPSVWVRLTVAAEPRPCSVARRRAASFSQN